MKRVKNVCILACASALFVVGCSGSPDMMQKEPASTSGGMMNDGMSGDGMAKDGMAKDGMQGDSMMKGGEMKTDAKMGDGAMQPDAK